MWQILGHFDGVGGERTITLNSYATHFSSLDHLNQVQTWSVIETSFLAYHKCFLDRPWTEPVKEESLPEFLLQLLEKRNGFSKTLLN